MHSLLANFLDQLTFDERQLGQLRALGDARGRQALWYQQAPERLAGLRQRAVVESSESSNRIEGVEVAAHRLKPLALELAEPRDRPEQEISGYRDALQLIHESAKEMPPTPKVLRQLHQRLFRYTPVEGGVWKNAANDIIEHLPDGRTRVRFQPTPPHLVDSQVTALGNHYQAAMEAEREALVIAPLAVLDFLCIHPFRDGNGRVARLLTLLLLYRHDYEVGRYISLERVIEETKDSYYETLEASSQAWHEGQHDVMPWLNYFWGMLQRAYGDFQERMDEMGASGHGSKTAQVRAAVERRRQPFSLSELVEDCIGVSPDMVRHVLRQMKDAGEVTVSGHGRGARWTSNHSYEKS